MTGAVSLPGNWPPITLVGFALWSFFQPRTSMLFWMLSRPIRIRRYDRNTFTFFKMPGQVAEAMLLENDAARLRAVYQGKLSEDQISANVQRLSEPGVLTAALNWYRALDLDARIGPIRVSTLYIWGDQDIALGRTAAETTQRYVMGQYHFEVLPGFSHWLQDEASEAIGNLITKHLSGRSA